MHKSLGSLALSVALLSCVSHAAQAEQGLGDPDRDGDGLSDFQEQHKYCTDPDDPDSDDDGIPDGEWNERREWTYTIRTVVQVLPPVTPDVTRDDYQDARFLEETGDYVELEVIHYPLNTVASAITGDPGWRDHRGPVVRWLEPGLTSNWDAELADDLRAALGAAGIDFDALDDKALVEQASHWLCHHAEYHDGFSTFLASFNADGKPFLAPELRNARQNGQGDQGLSLAEQWDRELFAKGMFQTARRGSCTSSAIYLSGCLRAIGIPTRTILTIPLVDASDRRELASLERLRHPKIRAELRAVLEPLSNSWASHTFNEVWVNGRWRRLNYDRLGQNSYDPSLFGLLTHVATFHDWSDANMPATWGLRASRSDRDDVFAGVNPYHSIDLSDRFGEHSEISPEELPPERKHQRLTIVRRYWYHSDERADPVAMRLDDPETAGHVVVRVAEFFAGEGTRQYREFYDRADHRFVMRADGQVDVPLAARRGWWCHESKGIRDFYLRIEPAHFGRLKPGVAYTLQPVVSPGSDVDYAWSVAVGVTLTRPRT